ncbi:alpha/beta hydrolase [Roseateles sp. BYS180W]|uniref:Alpha/beta hydrolase n=1 Tax=Roseateles rivi TaxID=3299028 RepID=A0ABW7FTW6_9BURK
MSIPLPPPRLLWLAALLSCSPLAQASASSSPTQACRVPGWANELQCGVVQRPLNPDDPKSVKIDVHYVVVPAVARNKRPDPLVFFAGGPGQSAITLQPKLMGQLRSLNTRRDLVFIDQRGTGRSAPLACPDSSKQSQKNSVGTASLVRELQACQAALQKLPHGDLRYYTTTLAMQDADAVRQQLGVAQWNLMGASYGTRAALEYQRQFPAAVRRTLIDGVAPPDMTLPEASSHDGQAALDTVFKACETEPSCAKQHPQLRQRWASLLQSLPRQAALRHPLNGVLENVTLERDDVVRLVRAPLYVPALSSALPEAIERAASGDFQALAGLSQGLTGGSARDRMFMGMHFSVVCAEDAPRQRASFVGGGDFGASDARFYGAVCQNWPRGSVPEAFYTTPQSRSAVLLLSGGADPVTPPRHGERIARALGSLALHVVAPNLGHGVMSQACLRDAIKQFFNADTDAQALQAVRDKADCLQSIPRALAYRSASAASAPQP